MNKSKFDKSLLSAPLTMKEYISQYKCDKEIFDLKEKHDIEELEKEFVNKNFFNSKIVKIFKSVVAIISIIATVVTIYMICKHNKLRALVTRLALQQVKVENMENKDNNCKMYSTALYKFNFKYHNDRFNCICNFTAQKNKIMYGTIIF